MNNDFWSLLMLCLATEKIGPITSNTKIENELDVTLCSYYYEEHDMGKTIPLCRKKTYPETCDNCINRCNHNFNEQLKTISKDIYSQLGISKDILADTLATKIANDEYYKQLEREIGYSGLYHPNEDPDNPLSPLPEKQMNLLECCCIDSEEAKNLLGGIDDEAQTEENK